MVMSDTFKPDMPKVPVIVRAPVRISFGGGGTDLAAYYAAFGGFVISTAITRYCYVVAREPEDRSIRLNSADYRIWEQFGPGEPPPVQEPLALPKAAIAWAVEQGWLTRGVDLFLAAEVPPGTGLGSSSAMTVALVHALAALRGNMLEPAAAAAQACRLEIERLGKPIGKQDQYASAYGGLNIIEFTDDDVQVTPLNMRREVMAALNQRLLLFATGQSRDSAGILGEQRKHTTTQPRVIEALHRIKSLAYNMCETLLAEDLDAFGRLLDQAWQQKRRLSGKVSSAAIDTWYAAARAAGALGGKITGAGGGGFLLLYCPPEHQAAVRRVMTEHGLQELAFDIDLRGAQALPSAPAEQPAAAHVPLPASTVATDVYVPGG